MISETIEFSITKKTYNYLQDDESEQFDVLVGKRTHFDLTYQQVKQVISEVIDNL